MPWNCWCWYSIKFMIQLLPIFFLIFIQQQLFISVGDFFDLGLFLSSCIILTAFSHPLLFQWNRKSLAGCFVFSFLQFRDNIFSLQIWSSSLDRSDPQNLFLSFALPSGSNRISHFLNTHMHNYSAYHEACLRSQDEKLHFGKVVEVVAWQQ